MVNLRSWLSTQRWDIIAVSWHTKCCKKCPMRCLQGAFFMSCVWFWFGLPWSSWLSLETNQFILHTNPLLMHFITICKRWNWFLNLSSLWIHLHLLSCLTTFVKDMRPEVTCMLPFNLSKMAGYLWTSFSLCVMFPLLSSCISSRGLHIISITSGLQMQGRVG